MPLKFGNRDILNIAQAVERNKEDIEALKNRPLLEIEIVDELPETGQEGILYLVPAEDSDEGNLYEEYVWVNDAWEQVGSASIDLSAYPTLAGDNTFTGKNTFEDKITASDDLQTHDIYPATSGDYSIGTTTKAYNEVVSNKYTVAATGYNISKDGANLKIQADGNPIQFRGNVEPTVDGTYALGKSNVRWSVVNSSKLANDYSNLTLKGNPGITLQMSANSSITPSNDASYTIGTSTARFKSLNLSHYVDWNNNVFIGKDSSNRFYVSGSDGNIKLKIGASETLVATKLSPDVSNSYDIGRTGLRWNYGYINYLVASDDTVIPTTDIAMKSTSQATEVWAQGTLDSSTAEDTIDISAQGVGMPDAGIYMFTYGNAQTMLYLDSTMIQNAALYPIRVTCPVLQEAGGNISGATGNLKISRSSDVLTIKVASTISGNATSTNGWGWKLFKTGL